MPPPPRWAHARQSRPTSTRLTWHTSDYICYLAMPLPQYPDYSFSLSSIRKRLRLPTTDPSLPSLRPNIPASSIIGYPRAPLRSQTQHFSSSNASTSSSSSSPPPVLRRRSTFNTLPRGVMRPAPSLDELLDLPPSYGARNPRVVAAAADVDPDLNWEFEELLRRSVAPGESGRGTRGEAGRPGYQPSVSSSLPGYEDVGDGTTSVRSLAVG